LNQNGIQDTGEPGINGVRVRLFACDNSGSVTGSALASQNTANGGKYLFTGLDAGKYAVVFDLPSGFVFTTQNAGNNEGLDSDVDNTGTSDCFDLAAGQAERRVDAGVFEPAPQKIDLELTKSVDDPAPQLGDQVLFTLDLSNVSAVDATGVEVVDTVPAGLSIVSVNSTSTGSANFVNQTLTWTVGDLDAGASATLTFFASVDQKGTFKNIAEVTAADQDDVDSTPNNDDGDQSEDDEDNASVTTGGSTGGGGGGVESDGDMASVLAQRMFERRADAMTKQAHRAAPSPIVMTTDSRAATLFSAGKGGSTFDIANLLPETGPQNSQAMVVTPDDLLGATNATSVFSADYVRTDGRRLGAILGLTSAGGSLYDHTKNTCDRLGGGRLDAVKLMAIDGRQYTLSTLIHADGQIDHAISFVAYRMGSSYAVDSRFAPDSYDIPAGVDEVINMQVWSVSTAYTAELVREVISRLEAQGSVSFINEGDTAPNVPSLYIHSGQYTDGQLTLRMVNTTGQPQTVLLSGSTTMTETEAQLASRTALERAVVIPAPAAGEHTVDVVVETGAIFDAAFTIEYEGDVMDRVYWSDGPWGTNGGNANVAIFETYASDATAGESAGGGALMERYDVERDAYMGGTVTDYAVLFRYLRPAAMPVDLSTMTHLEFTAYGRGSVGLYVEKASITDGDQYGTTFRLGTEPQTYRIALSELRQQLGTTGFTADDVTAVMFYVTGNGQSASAFDLVVESMAFTGGSTSVAIEDETEAPSAFELSQNYPNPFNPSTRISFTVPQSQEVRLVVYDVLGRPVQTLMNGVVRAGSHEVTFEAGNLPSGTYLYRLDANGQSLTRTLTLMK
ncbi:MAG: SdrD B-like domain-containing protein, partial [Bacteroidota bacterium]